MRLPRSVQVMVFALVGLVLLPAAPAETSEPDKRIHADAKPCLDALGVDIEDPGTKSCVVTYAHIDQSDEGVFALKRPPDDLEPRVHPAEGDFESIELDLPPSSVSYSDDGLLFRTYPLDRMIRFAPQAPIETRSHFTLDREVDGSLFGPECVTIHVALMMWDPITREDVPLTENEVSGRLEKWGPPPIQEECPDQDAFEAEDDHVAVTVSLDGIDTSGRSFSLRVTAWETDDDGEDRPVPGLKLLQDPEHPNHLLLPLHEALYHDTLEANWSDDRLLVRVVVKSPTNEELGAPERTTTRIIDPEGRHIVELSYVAQPHAGVSVAWIAGTVHAEGTLRAGDLKDGDHHIQTVSWNIQHTARVEGMMDLQVRDDGHTLIITDPVVGKRTYNLASDDKDCDCPEPETTGSVEALEEQVPFPGAAPIVALLAMALHKTGRIRYRHAPPTTMEAHRSPS